MTKQQEIFELEYHERRVACRLLLDKLRTRTVLLFDLPQRPDGLPDDGDLSTMIFFQDALSELDRMLDRADATADSDRDWNSWVVERLQAGDTSHGKPAAVHAARKVRHRWTPTIYVMIVVSVMAATLVGGSVITIPEPPARTLPCKTLGLSMVRIPAGPVSLGSDEQEKNVARRHVSNEWALSQISGETGRREDVDSFYMSPTEISIRQFREFLHATGYVPFAVGLGGIGYDAENGWHHGDEFDWQTLGISEDDRLPVMNITSKDAAAFCRWLSQSEGITYRLPTESEWERAAGAGLPGYWWTGSRASDAKTIGTTSGPDSDGYDGPHPVGSGRPNPFGLFGVIGNANEFTSDYLDRNPNGRQRPFFVVKGGSFRSSPWMCRTHTRLHIRDGRVGAIGFRVCRDDPRR